MLSTTRTLIVDEIHAMVDDKRGSHLSLSVERLQALVKQPLVRIGLSATQKPIEEARDSLSAPRILNRTVRHFARLSIRDMRASWTWQSKFPTRRSKQ